MYAIVTTGGKQYKVAEGDVIDVEKLEAEPGDKVELDVLLLADGAGKVVAADELANAKASAEVIEQFRGKKVLVFKLKKRKRYHRTKGHRQMLTKIKVTSMPTTRTSASKAASTKDESAKASE